MLLSLFFIVILVSKVSASADTVVTFTFDAKESYCHQRAGDALKLKGVYGTFYYAQNIGSNFRLSLNGYKQLFRDGHEVGGQTVNYLDFVDKAKDKIQDEICLNRKYLFDKGFKPTSFAYPYGRYTFVGSVNTIKCGYNSATNANFFDLRINDMDNVQRGESYNINTFVIQSKTTFDELMSIVQDALKLSTFRRKLLVFRIYDVCDNNNFNVETLTKFVEWLLQYSYIEIQRLDKVIGEELSPIPEEYNDNLRLLPETKSKLIITGITVAAMIFIIVLFFVTSALRDVIKKLKSKTTP